MSSLRLFGLTSLLVAALLRPAFAADETVRLLQSVPAGAPLLMHLRNVAQVRADFAHTPYAKMWAEPEVKAFFAPTVTLLNSPDAQKGFDKFENLTGLAPLDFLSLFSGELVFAVMVPPGAEGMPVPHVVFGGSLGTNRAKLEGALKKASTSTETEAVGSVAHEEFQGETVHTFFAKDEKSGEPKETVSWTLVDDVVWFGYPKAAVQGIVASFKRGGATEPITASAGFGPVYQRNPGAQAAYYLDIESLVRIGMSVYKAQEAAKQLEAEAEKPGENEEPDVAQAAAEPSMMEKMGLTPEVIVHALGLDALRAVYAVTTGDKAMTAMTAGITWTEQRGLLRMLAYGDAPAPQPAFVSPDWASVTSVRFKIPEILESIKESARTANPMFEFMLAQQLAALKEQVGIDVERDFFGSFGDEIVRAYFFPADNEDSIEGNEQLWAISLTNAEAFTRTLEVVWGMAPQVAQMFEDREYLGHTIRSITAPIPGAGGSTLMTISYVITPTHLFLDVGGAKMIETAVQRLNTEGDSFWTLPAVVAAMKDLPPGGSSFTYQDIRQVIYSSLVQVTDIARKSAEAAGGGDADPELDEDGRPLTPRSDTKKGSPPGLHMFIDPAALPSRATVEKYFGASYGAIYRDADGIRFHARYKNVP